MVVWSCVFLDAKKKRKSCGFVLSLTNFEIKKKERIFQHLAYSNEVPRLHPETTRQISLRNFVTTKKKKRFGGFSSSSSFGGFFFFFSSKQWGGVFLRFSFEDKLLFFFPQMNKDPPIFFTHKNSVKKTNNIPR